MSNILTMHVGSLPRTQKVVDLVFAGFGAVDPEIAYAKLGNSAEGAGGVS